MKVLHVNFSDVQGGAARAAYRLHRALLSLGEDSRMLVGLKDSDDYTVTGRESNFEKAIAVWRPILDSLPQSRYPDKGKTLFSPSWLPLGGIVRMINEMNPDIVHLHWICGGMIRIEHLAGIRAPVVWSLHDMWAFTGGCHYDDGCGGYTRNCGNCRVLGSKRRDDLSFRVWKRKCRTFSKMADITAVGLSKWITGCAKESSLLKNRRIKNIPNLLDTTVFKPFDRQKARELLSLPQKKRIVLFGSMEAKKNPRKGFNILKEALLFLKRKDAELVVFGSSEPVSSNGAGLRERCLGNLFDDASLAALYSAADVTVVPSLQENLSCVIMESLACGTPVVAFDTGGNSDLVEHGRNGYLARAFSPEDFAEGINWSLNDSRYETLGRNAREKVLREFDNRATTGKYVALYKEVLGKIRS